MGCSCISGSGPILLGQGGVQVSGSGTPTDPYYVSQDYSGQALQLEVRDSSTVNMTVFGSGTRTDPYIIRADTSSASSLRSLGDVSPTPSVTQGAVPQWIGSTAGGHFEFRTPGVRYTTSLTRGYGLYQGELIRETDTQKRYEWDGSQWVDLTPAYVPPSALDPSVVANAGSLDPSTDWNTLSAKSGIYRVSTYASNVNGPAGAYNYGTLEVIISGLSASQTYYEHGSGGLWWRTKFNASDWTTWTKAASNADVQSQLSNLSTKVTNEISDRTNAVAGVSQRISAEINDRISQAGGLQTAINARASFGYVDQVRTDLSPRLDRLESSVPFSFTVANNFTVNRVNTWTLGGICQLDISLTRQGTAIGSGNITNILVGTVAGGFGVNGYANLGNGPGGGVASGYINNVGVYLSATTQTINVGDEVTLVGTWIRS